MLTLSLIALFLVQIVVVARYVNLLSVIASLSREYNFFSWYDNSRLTNYHLLRNPRFYLFINLNKFDNNCTPENLKQALKTARKYLIAQYPIAITIFSLVILIGSQD